VTLVEILLLLLGGAVSGFLAGLFGVGGGIILVPILLFYFQTIGVTSLVATHMAFGTSLLIVVLTSIASGVQYARNGHVVWKAVIALGVTSVIGGLLGSQFAGSLQGKTLRQIFAAVVIVAALRLLVENRKSKKEQMPEIQIPALLGGGFVVGIISALAGVGGGVLSIPIMHSLLKFPLKKALGTSSVTIVVTALAAGVGYVVSGWGNPLLPPNTLGYVDYLHALPLIVGAIPMATVGAHTSNKTQVALLKKIFAVFLFVVALKLLFF
jgi:uncharacterized protein